MKRIKCKDVLLDYIQTHEGWLKKVDLYKIAEEFSPETAGRALRLLAEENKIQVQYYDSKYAKNLAMYSRIGEAPKKFEPNIITKSDGSRVLLVRE